MGGIIAGNTNISKTFCPCMISCYRSKLRLLVIAIQLHSSNLKKMKNHKSAIKAVYLNIILPGLGLAYLGRWGYAVLFLFWTPLRLLVGSVLIGFIFRLELLGIWGGVIRYILVYAWWAVVMYDTCTTPYKFAQEHNQKLESQPVPE